MTENNSGINQGTNESLGASNPTTSNNIGMPKTDETPTTSSKFGLFSNIAKAVNGSYSILNHVAKSAALAEVASEARTKRKIAFARNIHTFAQDKCIEAPHCIRLEYSDDHARTLSTNYPAFHAMPAAAQRPDQIPAHRILPTQSNTIIGPELIKLRVAYQAEKESFDSGYHRGQSRDKHLVNLALLRYMDQSTIHYVSWLHEALCAVAFDHDLNHVWFRHGHARALGPNDDLRPAAIHLADANRARWMGVHPHGLNFRGYIRKLDFPTERGIGQRIHRGPNQRQRGNAGEIGFAPEVQALVQVGQPTMLHIVAIEHLADAVASGLNHAHVHSGCFYVSKARTTRELLFDIMRFAAGLEADHVTPVNQRVDLIAPNMLEASVRDALETVGFVGWKHDLLIPCRELARHIGRSNEADVLNCTSSFEMFDFDWESILMLTATQNLTVAPGTGILTFPQANANATFSIQMSPWVYRVAAACGFMGAELDLVRLPDYSNLQHALVTYGIEMARWVDMSIMRVAGSLENVRLNRRYSPLADIVTFAIAAWAIYNDAGSLIPVIPVVRPVLANAAGNNGQGFLEITARRDWAFLMNFPDANLWDTSNVVELPPERPGRPKTLSTGQIAYHQLRNALARGRINQEGIAQANHQHMTFVDTIAAVPEGLAVHYTVPWAGEIPFEMLRSCGAVLVSPVHMRSLSYALDIPYLSDEQTKPVDSNVGDGLCF